MDEDLKTAKIHRPKNTNLTAILQQKKDLNQMAKGMFSENTKKQMQQDVDSALSQVLAFESFRQFQADMETLRKKCQGRVEENENLAKSVKSNQQQRKLISMIADAKGVKAEDIKEADVISQNVELPIEVMSLQFLYKRKFEKQYGVVLDRPEGSKGDGKGGKGGTTPTQKSFLVRGLKDEVSTCIKALRALNLREQKVMEGLTSKQEDAIMNVQQAKLEVDYPSVFLHRGQRPGASQGDRRVITLYGPPKEVAACSQSIQDNLPEEPVSNPPMVMQVDKDLAKCFIGAGGGTVSKVESETSTSIKVSNHQSKDDGEQATIRITGDKANQEKARAKINAFLGTLTSCLVEAGPEAVSKLYESAAPRKGKGKNKGGEDATNSKFAELWNSSGLTCLKKAGGVQLVGDKAAVTKWKAVLKECLLEAGTVPLTIKLSFEQARLLSQERLDSVLASSGAQKVQKVSKGRESFIEVTGGDDEKEKAKTAIQEINDKMSSFETIEDVDESSPRYLTSKGVARSVEQAHDVCVTVDRKGQSVKITGGVDNIAAAKKQLEQILSSSASTTREIEIEWDEGRVVIGKGGSTVDRIRRESGVESVKVEESEDKKKVVLRGRQDACEVAEKMIKQALQKDKERAAERAAKAESKGASNNVADKSVAKEAAEPVAPSEEKRPSEKKWSKSSTTVEYKEDKDSFPSLGPGGGKPGSKEGQRIPKNSAWKSAEEEVAADNPAMAGDDAAAEEDEQ